MVPAQEQNRARSKKTLYAVLTSSMDIVPSITKKFISYLLVLGQQLLITFQMQNFK